MDVKTEALGQVLDTRQESEVPVMGYENQTFSKQVAEPALFFQPGVWGQMCSPQSGTQDEKVRSRSWATKIQYFQTSLRARLGFFSEMGVGKSVFAPVWNPRRESEVLVIGYQNPTFPNMPQSLPCFFQNCVWGQRCSPRSGTHDEKVRSLPWATKI